jgi:hypothetical protein
MTRGRERCGTGILRSGALGDAQQLVVLRDGARRAQRPDLDLAGRGANRKVRHERIFRFSGTGRDDRRVARALRLRDHVERAAQRPVLVRLDEHRVRDAFADAARDTRAIRREEIVAHELQHATQAPRQRRPARPVLLGERVFDRHEREFARPAVDHADHRLARAFAAFARKKIATVGLQQRARRDVHGDGHVHAGCKTRALDRLDHQFERHARRPATGTKSAFVGEERRQSALAQDGAGRGANACNRVNRLGDRRRTHRHDEKVLHVHAAAGMQAAAQDVRHRQREHRLRLREIADALVQCLPARGSGRAAHRERYAERRVGTEPAQLRRAVELAQAHVDRCLIGPVDTTQRAVDLRVHVGDGAQYAETRVACGIPVAQFVRFGRAGRCARRHAGAADAAAVQHRVELDGRATARIENFARVQRADRRCIHGAIVPRRVEALVGMRELARRTDAAGAPQCNEAAPCAAPCPLPDRDQRSAAAPRFHHRPRRFHPMRHRMRHPRLRRGVIRA